MPVIDQSTTIDDSKLFGLKETVSDPIFQEMEESESENLEIEQPVQQNQFVDRNTEEKAFYASLSDTEKDAWDRGWRTGKFFKGKFKDGTPKPHKSAEEFLAIQERETPILNERNRKLTSEKTALEKEMSELRKQMDVMLNVQKIAYEEKTQNKFQSLEEAEEAAILEGDVAKVRAIQKQRLELEKNKISFEEPEIEQPKTALSRDDKELMDNWVADNTWFHQDKVMQASAAAYFGTLSERIPLEERLELVSNEIRNRFSDKLGVSKAPRVESGVRGMQNARKQHSYNDLPAEIKKSCEFFAKRYNFDKDKIAKMQQTAIKEYFK
jgi:hypothetical protein